MKFSCQTFRNMLIFNQIKRKIISVSVIYQNNFIQEDNDVILTLQCLIGSNVTIQAYKIN